MLLHHPDKANNAWNKHDPTSRNFVLADRENVERTPTGDGWAEMMLRPQLSETVPEDVVELFEVARSILLYGWYFYPLYTTGSQQLFQVHEAALFHRCKELGSTIKDKTFSEKLEWLLNEGHIDKAREGQWDAARRLRNSAAHQTRQFIYDPSMAVYNVEITVELINELFSLRKGPSPA